jgi:hypothetical protein
LPARNSRLHRYTHLKTNYTITRDQLVPPVRNRELALFTCMLQAPAARKALAELNITVPARFPLIHNSGTDDPPDIEALGLGWECTDFPPDQQALDAVHREVGAMVIPPYSRTRGEIKRIRQAVTISHVCPPFVSADEVLAALSRAFLERVIGGPKSKDVPGNDVLLLDQRYDPSDFPEIALRLALRETKPRHLRLILLVRWQQGKGRPLPDAVQVYP